MSRGTTMSVRRRKAVSGSTRDPIREFREEIISDAFEILIAVSRLLAKLGCSTVRAFDAAGEHTASSRGE